MDQRLHGYAYRTPISWWVFVASGLILILAALITLAIQTIRTARANPVESLRVE